MKNLTDYIYENLVMESNDLWKKYTYFQKNMPKQIPFEEGQKVTEEDLVKYYNKILSNPNLSYSDINFIAVEQYVMSNWENVRLLDMKFTGGQGRTQLVVEYGPKDTPRKSKGTIVKSKPGYEFELKDGENNPVEAKEWIHALVTFLNDNIKE